MEEFPACPTSHAEVNLVSPESRASGRNPQNALVGDLDDLVSLVSLISDTIFSGIIVCDCDSKILYMNRFYAHLMGIRAGEAAGKDIRVFFPLSRVPTVLKTGQSELWARCTLRSEIDYVVNRIPIKKDGQTVGVILQTAFKRFSEVNDLMKRLKSIEERMLRYKKGLDSMLSATYTFDSIVGESPEIQAARDLAHKYARTDGSVMILGATGTGKELFAHAIHQASHRRLKPFVCLNCASFPRELLESELFGYEQGAFTGAHPKGKAGKIELAHRGTLFLDEIGDIPISAQAKILRVLETRKVDRVGGVKAVDVDFRLIAATNRDIEELISKGLFREDLYYRLNTMTVHLPPLTGRQGDIPALTEHFLHQLGKNYVQVRDSAWDRLKAHAWPGNVRELKNVIERAVSLLEGDLLDVSHLPDCLGEPVAACLQKNRGKVRTLAEEIAECERQVLLRALEETGHNMVRTAKLLRISRSTLYEKCKLHQL